MQKKGISIDLSILEQLPVFVDLMLLVDQFAHYKQPRKKVYDLAQGGFLELVKRGSYINLKSKDFKQNPLEALANAIYFPSYVSAEWALQYYGLLTERVHTITSVTSRKSASFKTSLAKFEYQHTHKHRFPFGYDIDTTHSFMIARPEKALLDYLSLGDHLNAWKNHEELEKLLEEDLRLNMESLFQQIRVKNLQEIISHYHRNSKEARIIKWLLAKKEKSNG